MESGTFKCWSTNFAKTAGLLDKLEGKFHVYGRKFHSACREKPSRKCEDCNVKKHVKVTVLLTEFSAIEKMHFARQLS